MKPKIAVHKFASCDGCQLAFLNAGEVLLELAAAVDFVHFAEAGPIDPEAEVDIAFIEGSITTAEDEERIRNIRSHSRKLITLGACATAGGLQALRNYADASAWVASIYAQPEYIASLSTSTPISRHVKVDLELWGCPVTSEQVLGAIRSLLFGVPPPPGNDKVCLECKRQQNVCVMVAGTEPCLGPVTQTGCGAICPHFRRGCYGCFGPAENPNTLALGRWLQGFGLTSDAVAQRFRFINADAGPFRDAVAQLTAPDET